MLDVGFQDSSATSMITFPDLLYVALFAAAWPLVDYFILWPAFLRRSQANPAQARLWLWIVTIAQDWGLVAAGSALWLFYDRSWSSLGFSVPAGWRPWVAIILALLLAAYYARTAAAVARSARAKASVRKQFGKLAAILPHTRRELYWFASVSLTAGFCEEFLFRGYFIWTFTPWLGWWGGAALSVPCFAVLHAYQGWNGALRTGVVGVLFTLVVALFGSLWPAIVLHALVDVGAGLVAWPALREEPGMGDATVVEKRTEAPSASPIESTQSQVEPEDRPHE
jgi:membrane protease YdiL (CAAX protease family)